jgi:3-isopropylmalate dehydrogenase
MIAVLQGDGAGPGLVAEALETLGVISPAWGLDCETAVFPCGGEYWKKHGEEWPREAREFCEKEADAILFGSVGVPGIELPSGDLAGVELVFFLRQGLDLYANVRPVQLLTELPGTPYSPDQIRLHLVREATEGLYARMGGMISRVQKPELAIDVRLITVSATERIARFAFRLAERLATAGESRPVTCIDKSNVLGGCRLFRRTVRAVAEEFPQLQLKFAYVDNFALDVLRRPQDYSVCVTSNAFGDILADLLAYHEGGPGMGATGNFGDRKAMFEPLHAKGNVNPIAIHRSLAMLLAWLGQSKRDARFTCASEQLMAAISAVLKAGKVRTPDLGGASSTSEMCQAIRQAFLSVKDNDKEGILP